MFQSVSLLRRGLLLAALVGQVACSNALDHSGASDTDTDGADTGVGPCDTDPQIIIGGQWDPIALNWSDVSEPVPGADQLKSAPYDDILPHHGYLTAVHAAHLPTGQLFMYHGQSEERLWTIDAPPEEMKWLPIPFGWDVNSEFCSYPPPPLADECFPDIFCSGALLIEQGLFVAGGNVNGTAAGGGIFESYLFNPLIADPDVAPFGWAEGPDMAVDRWYPSVTQLPVGGQVLISGGASATTVDVNGTDVNGQNTFELYDPIANTITLLPVTFDWGNMPTYPFMFLLSNGDILYAGGEGGGAQASHGRVLIPDYNDPQNWSWDDKVITSTTSGGSAVMYARDKIMKSGGIINDTQYAVAITETLDLFGYETGDYDDAPTEFTVADPMNFPRHFHTLTLLPDGRVLATGGNEKGNGAAWHNLSNECDYPSGTESWIVDMPCTEDAQCPAIPGRCVDSDANGTLDTCPTVGQSCTTHSECAAACSVDADCPLGATCSGGECLLGTLAAVGECSEDPPPGETDRFCDPGRNSCYATLAAEIWDPACDEWVLLGEQEHPRMYHSTAMLLPDGRVISMGGGHTTVVEEETDTEFFEPDYGAGPKPVISIGGLPQSNDVAAVNMNDTDAFSVSIENADDIEPDRVVVMGLSSVTHQFDVGQSIIQLDAEWEDPWTGDLPMLSVSMPGDANVTPPGYYMLFVISTTGEPSEGHYLRVSRGVSPIFKCPATTSLTVVENSCDGEPAGAACPSGDEEQNPVTLPLAEGPSGSSSGWQVAVPPGMVMDASQPTTAELDAVEGLCIEACSMHWADAAVDADCDAAGAFDPPVYVGMDDVPAFDATPHWHQHAEEVFTGQQLSCSLGMTCYGEFDEDLRRASPVRPTPAESALATGEEFRVALGGLSKLEVVTPTQTYETGLSGEVGFSSCRDGNSTAPCGFYLGSLSAATSAVLTPLLICDDGTTQTVSLDSVSFHLGQPAFGIAKTNSIMRGFPPGALMLDSSVQVDGVIYEQRAPNTGSEVVFQNIDFGFSASDLEVVLRVPCNQSTATLSALITLKKSPNSSALAEPPDIAITTPSKVSCTSAVNLMATATDPDGDLVDVRWRVDGVLLAPGTTSIPFTQGHTLEAVAEDARGARTTDTRVVSCL